MMRNDKNPSIATAIKRTEVQMWPISCSTVHCLLILVIFETVGLTATAMAEPIAPSKIRTITIRPQSTEDHGEPPASPASSSKVHTLKVRPRLSGESSDASGRQLTGEQNPGNAASDADNHKVRTFSVRPSPDATSDTYRHLVPATRVPAGE
jgi:hypothetical protein